MPKHKKPGSVKDQKSSWSQGLRKFHPSLLRTHLLVSLILTSLLFVVHIARLVNVGALWRDEVVTINMSKMSFDEMWAVLNVESFPLLIHFVLKFLLIVGFTDTDFFLRAFGCIIGLSIIGAFWLNGRILGYSYPLLSLVLFGFNPWAVQYGDSIRAYGLGILLNLFTFAAIWKVTQSATPQRIIIAGIAAIASVQCLYQNAVFLLAISLGGCVVVLLDRNPRSLFAILGIGAVAALTLIPYRNVIESARNIAVVVNLPIGYDRIWLVLSDALGSPEQYLRWIWIGVVAIGVLFGGWMLMRGRSNGATNERQQLSVFCTVAMVLGTVGFLIFLKTARFITEPWYYLPLMAFVAISLEGILIGVRETTIGIIVTLTCAIFITATGIVPLFKSTETQFTNMDAIADKLEELATPDDIILINPWYCGTTFQRYYQGSTEWMSVPPVDDYSVQRPDIIKQKMTMIDPLQPVFSVMKAKLESGHRVWIAGGLDFPPEGQNPPKLPIAPNGPNGWYSFDYLIGWSLQCGHFVRTHALHGEQIAVPVNAPVSLYEQHGLILVSGWQSAAR